MSRVNDVLCYTSRSASDDCFSSTSWPKTHGELSVKAFEWSILYPLLLKTNTFHFALVSSFTDTQRTFQCDKNINDHYISQASEFESWARSFSDIKTCAEAKSSYIRQRRDENIFMRLKKNLSKLLCSCSFVSPTYKGSIVAEDCWSWCIRINQKSYYVMWNEWQAESAH